MLFIFHEISLFFVRMYKYTQGDSVNCAKKMIEGLYVISFFPLTIPRFRHKREDPRLMQKLGFGIGHSTETIHIRE